MKSLGSRKWLWRTGGPAGGVLCTSIWLMLALGILGGLGACGGGGGSSDSSGGPSDPSEGLVIQAPSRVSVGMEGYAVSVPAQEGTTYSWKISGGSFSGGKFETGGSCATFSATAPGVVQVRCVATCGDRKVEGTVDIPASEASISRFIAAPGTISGTQSSLLNCEFSQGKGEIDQGIGIVTSGRSIRVNPASTTTYTLKVTDEAGQYVEARTNVVVGNDSSKNSFDSFEGSLGDIWYTEMAGLPYSGACSNRHALDGASSFRIELHKTDPEVCDSKRSEVVLNCGEGAREEHTYSFAILLPDGGEEDYALDEGSEIIAQWHNVPDSGEPWTTPPLALRTWKGHYFLERCWDDAPITSSEQMTRKGYRARYDLGSYLGDIGKFVQWTFHLKWGWLASQGPRLEVFKNGTRLVELNGYPNTTNDQKGVYFKFGIYKWDWAQSDENDVSVLAKRIIYYDNISTWISRSDPSQ